MTGQQWVQFGAILAVVLFIPGPDFAVVVGHATKSRRYGAIVAAGTICGLLAHTLAASIGLTAVIASHPQILGAIRWTSAALLVVLGARLVARAFREHRGGAATESAATNDSAAQADSTISAGGPPPTAWAARRSRTHSACHRASWLPRVPSFNRTAAPASLPDRERCAVQPR